MPGRLARMRSTSSQNWRRDSGSTPVVGSSRISRSGSWIRAQHRQSFCFMPPDSLPAGRSGKGPSPMLSSSSAMRRLRLGPALAEQPGEEVGVLEDRQGRVQVLAQPLRHVGDARAGRSAEARVGHVAAEHLDLPLLNLAGAGDERQQTGLSHAVRADQPDHAAGRQIEGDRIEGTGLAVPQAHVRKVRHRSRIGYVNSVVVRSAHFRAHLLRTQLTRWDSVVTGIPSRMSFSPPTALCRGSPPSQ